MAQINEQKECAFCKIKLSSGNGFTKEVSLDNGGKSRFFICSTCKAKEEAENMRKEREENKEPLESKDYILIFLSGISSAFIAGSAWVGITILTKMYISWGIVGMAALITFAIKFAAGKHKIKWLPFFAVPLTLVTVLFFTYLTEVVGFMSLEGIPMNEFFSVVMLTLPGIFEILGELFSDVQMIIVLFFGIVVAIMISIGITRKGHGSEVKYVQMTSR